MTRLGIHATVPPGTQETPPKQINTMQIMLAATSQVDRKKQEGIIHQSREVPFMEILLIGSI